MKWLRKMFRFPQLPARIRWRARGPNPTRNWEGMVNGEPHYSILQEHNNELLWSLGNIRETDPNAASWRRLCVRCSLEDAKKYAEAHLHEAVILVL